MPLAILSSQTHWLYDPEQIKTVAMKTSSKVVINTTRLGYFTEFTDQHHTDEICFYY